MKRHEEASKTVQEARDDKKMVQQVTLVQFTIAS